MYKEFNVNILWDKTLKEDINQHCYHLIESPIGDTGIPKSYFNKVNWTSRPAVKG
jgi:hypothetical protein